MKRAGIIGAGVAGLVAALYLRRGGYEVTVFEKNSHPGGKLSRLHSNGYSFDMGPTVLTMPFVLRDVFADHNEILEDHLVLHRVEPTCRYHWSNGTRFDAFSDTRLLRDELSKVFPEDQVAVEEFLKDAATIYEATKEVFLFNPFRGFREIVRKENMALLPRMAKLGFTNTVHKSLQQRFTSPMLVQLFDRYATYNGSSPYRAPATLNVIPHVEFHYGAWYPEGGMYRIIEELVDLAQRNGITIETSTEVSEVRKTDKRITDVVANGRARSFDVVISNVDVLWSYRALFEPAGIPVPRNVRNAERSCSGFLMLGEVKGKHPELAHHNIFFSDDYATEFQNIFQRKTLPKEMTIYVSIASKCDASLAPEKAENWYILVNAPAGGIQHTDEKGMAEYAKQVWQRLAEFGLHPDVINQHLMTPQDIETRYNSVDGAIYGASSNSIFSAFLRPANAIPGIENAFFAGGSSHPGGGVPLAILSGKIAARQILEQFPSGK